MQAFWRKRVVNSTVCAAGGIDAAASPPAVARKIVVLGIPHPFTRALFDCLTVIAAACDNQPPLELSLVTAASAPLPDTEAIYLRADATDALSGAEGWCADPDHLPLAAALLSALDSRWRHLPAWSLETLANDPAAAPELLTNRLGLIFGEAAFAAARQCFDRIRPIARAYSDPVGFLAAIDIDVARHELLAIPGRTYSLSVPVDGAQALAGEWRSPDVGGARGAGAWPRLSLAVPGSTHTLLLRCDPASHDPEAISVNGRPAAWEAIRSAASTDLRIALPPSDRDQPRALLIELRVAARAFDAKAFRVEAGGSTEEAAAGRRGSRPSEGVDPLPMPAAVIVVEERSGGEILVISSRIERALADADPALLCHAAIVAICLRDDRAPPPGAFPAARSEASRAVGFLELTDDLSASPQRFSTVYLHGVADCQDIAQLVERAMPSLAFGGRIIGVERTEWALRTVAARLCDVLSRYGFTVMIEGTSWQAVPPPVWGRHALLLN